MIEVAWASPLGLIYGIVEKRSQDAWMIGADGHRSSFSPNL
ncbi:MAG: hypothetical protein ABIQ03_06205 [Burkholderiales bacterium]